MSDKTKLWVIEWAGMPYGPYNSLMEAAVDAENRGLIYFHIKAMFPRFKDEPLWIKAEVIK